MDDLLAQLIDAVEADESTQPTRDPLQVWKRSDGRRSMRLMSGPPTYGVISCEPTATLCRKWSISLKTTRRESQDGQKTSIIL
jgi:hypothetical protein